MAVHHVKVLVASPGYVATSVSQNALTGSGAAHGGKYIYNQSTARHSFVDINNFTSLIVCVCSDGSRNWSRRIARQVRHQIGECHIGRWQRSNTIPLFNCALVTRHIPNTILLFDGTTRWSIGSKISQYTKCVRCWGDRNEGVISGITGAYRHISIIFLLIFVSIIYNVIIAIGYRFIIIIIMTHNASNGIIINWTWNAARIAPSAR